MATIPLKDITFPGLDNKYTIPEIDSTLSTAGKAADAKKTGDEIESLKLTAAAQKDDMLKAFPTDTASGSVASFADGANVPVKSLVVNIDPVQSGSGDPSPTNIRPISGWTGAVVSVSGHNLFDKTKATPNSAINSQGIVISGSFYVSDFIPVKPDTDYYIKNVEVSIHARSLCFYGVDKSFISVESVSGGDSIHAVSFSKHIPSNVYYIRIMAHPDYIDSAGVNYPSTDTDYHSYGGNTYTIQLGQTVYGGTLDVTNGVLTVDRILFNMTSIQANAISNIDASGKSFIFLAPVKAISYAATENGIISNRYKSVSYTTEFNDSIFMPNASLLSIRSSTVIGTTASEIVEYFAGHDTVISYRVADPTTIQLDPHEVTALLGSNNIWADTGDTAVEYRADTKLYIQKKIAEAISALS